MVPSRGNKSCRRIKLYFLLLKCPSSPALGPFCWTLIASLATWKCDKEGSYNRPGCEGPPLHLPPWNGTWPKRAMSTTHSTSHNFHCPPTWRRGNYGKRAEIPTWTQAIPRQLLKTALPLSFPDSAFPFPFPSYLCSSIVLPYDFSHNILTGRAH